MEKTQIDVEGEEAQTYTVKTPQGGRNMAPYRPSAAVTLPAFEIWCSPLLTAGSCETYLTPPSLRFPLCKMMIVTVPMSHSYCEDSVKTE